MPATQYHEGRFPPAKLDWTRLLPLIGPANAAVARYDGVLHAIPNAQVLLSPLTSQEAVLSSRIEGTQATLGEVLEFEAAEETATGEKRDDIQEVLNYRRAMRHAVSALDWFFNRPIFRTSDFVASAGIPVPTANRIIRVVRNNGLLSEVRPASGRRAAIVAFPELLNIAEGRPVF